MKGSRGEPSVHTQVERLLGRPIRAANWQVVCEWVVSLLVRMGRLTAAEILALPAVGAILEAAPLPSAAVAGGPGTGSCRAHVTLSGAGCPDTCLFRARWTVDGVAVCGQHARCLERGTYLVWRGAVWPRARIPTGAQEG